MSLINALPASVDLKVYGGDALSFRVNVSGADYSAASWTGQVRLDHDGVVDAEFDIVPDSTGADVILPADQSRLLMLAGAAETPEYGAPKTSLVRRYYGVWDIQVDTGGVVRTLVQGLVEVYADVTRD